MEKFLEMMMGEQTSWEDGVTYWTEARARGESEQRCTTSIAACQEEIANWRACREWCEGLQKQLAAAENA